MKTCTKCGVLKSLEDFQKRKIGWESRCKTCAKAYMTEYREKNREELAAKRKVYWQDHRDERCAKLRERYAANKAYYRAINDRWAAANRDKMLAYYRMRGAVHRQVLDEIKDVPCPDCGRCYPPFVMEFDHVQGEKRYALGCMANHDPKAVAAEVEKCEVVCCACHRVRTQARKGESEIERVRAFREWLRPFKEHPCHDCGVVLPSVAMDFDHVNGTKDQAGFEHVVVGAGTSSSGNCEVRVGLCQLPPHSDPSSVCKEGRGLP